MAKNSYCGRSPFFTCLFVCSVLFLISGCSQPLRTLMAVGAEQKQQQAVIRNQNLRFESLLKAARTGSLKSGTAKQAIISRYGSPTLEKIPPFGLQEEKNIKTTVLYRSPVGYFNSPKVYLDFDENDILVNMRIEEPYER